MHAKKEVRKLTSKTGEKQTRQKDCDGMLKGGNCLILLEIPL